MLFDTGERDVRRKFPSFLKRGKPNLMLARKGESRLAVSFAYHRKNIMHGYCRTFVTLTAVI